MSRSSKINQEITSLLRARTSLLWIASREEKRVEAALTNCLPPKTKETTPGANDGVVMGIRFWDCISGLKEFAVVDGKSQLVSLSFTGGINSYGEKTPAKLSQGGSPITDPLVVLQAIREVPDRCLYVLRDINAYKDLFTLRALRNTATDIEKTPAREQRAMVILTPSTEIPPDLVGQANLIEYPIPDREDVAKIFDLLPFKENGLLLPEAPIREAGVDAALGLSGAEIQNCFYRSLVTLKRIDPQTIAQEKKRVIAREKVLTWIDPDPRGLDAVGGLEDLKEWVDKRKAGFSLKARQYGLKAPKGILISGIPGTGKSLTAKCVSTSWGMPLLKLDLGALQSKWIGESQANIRKALQIAEAVSPCVLWLDEIEKALAGSGSSSGDGGVAADALGAILNWMQEREGDVFVIATANDVRSLPPELLRKGRFDEIFWVDLPTSSEREAILLSALKQVGREAGVDIPALTERTKGWVGAEIASIVPEAMFAAFEDGGRQITTADLLTAAKTVVPLSTTMGTKLDEIRSFMTNKARSASRPEVVKETVQGRTLDLD